MASSGAGKPKSKGGGISGGAAEIGTKLGAGIAIAMELLSVAKDAISSLLNPIKGVLRGIFRIVGELLRPISEMLLLLLKPILLLLKPFLDMMKTFMAPFMDVAREFGRMAQAQMAQGNTVAAMNLSMEAVSTIMGPFVISLLSISMQLVVTTFVTMFSKMLGTIFPFAKNKIEESSQSVIDFTNTKLTDGTQFILDGLLGDAQRRLDEAKERIPSQYAAAMIEKPAGAIAEMSKLVEVTSTSMDKNMTEGMNAMDMSVLESFSAETGKAPTAMKSGLETMTSAVRLFAAKVEAYADDINSIKLKAPKRDNNDDDDSFFEMRMGGFGMSIG